MVRAPSPARLLPTPRGAITLDQPTHNHRIALINAKLQLLELARLPSCHLCTCERCHRCWAPPLLPDALLSVCRRVVDAASGEILQELVTPPGSSLVRIDPLAVPQARWVVHLRFHLVQGAAWGGWTQGGGSGACRESAGSPLASTGSACTLCHLPGVCCQPASQPCLATA